MKSSDHQHFKDLMLSEDLLTEEQRLALKEHLRICDVCRQQEAAWNQVHHLMRTSVLIPPAPGFVDRWHQRLAIRREKVQRRKAWLFFLISGVSALALVGLLGLQALQVLRSPEQILAVILYTLARMATYTDLVVDSLTTLRVILPSISVLAMILIPGFISLISVLWVVTYQQLSSARRFIR